MMIAGIFAGFVMAMIITALLIQAAYLQNDLRTWIATLVTLGALWWLLLWGTSRVYVSDGDIEQFTKDLLDQPRPSDHPVLQGPRLNSSMLVRDRPTGESVRMQ